MSLNNCPKLKGNIPINLPSLTSLELTDSPTLKGNNITSSNLPCVTELELSGCPLLVESGNSDDNSNNSLRPPDVLFSQLMLPPFNALRKLNIEGFPSLTSFPRDGLPKTLQSLEISDCDNLEFLPNDSMHSYTSLEDLDISSSCRSMTSFTLGSFPTLRSLYIDRCKNLKSILIAEDALQQSLSSLRSITVSNCDDLESISPIRLGLPILNLIDLDVSSCEKLCSLPEPINTFPGLQKLGIFKLPNLQYFAKEGLPINLLELSVGNVGGITEWGLERLTCLFILRTKGDDIVKALMKTENPLLPASLVSLHIYQLHDVECLDGKWLHHLTSFQT